MSKARGKTTKKRKDRRVSRKPCTFCKEQIEYIDYKDLQLIGRFMNDRGKIAARRVSGTCAKHQRHLSIALKRARAIALLPYVKVYYR